VTTKPSQGSRHLRALRNILGMEAASGFANRAVAGGLDGFLRTLLAESAHESKLRPLADHGLLSAAYGDLSLAQRERWAQQVLRVLPDAPPAGKQAPTPAPPQPVTKPKAPALTLNSPVELLRSVNRPSAAKLAVHNVTTVRDLVLLFPNRHLDYTARRRIAQLQPGEEQTIIVSVWEMRERRMGRGGRMRNTEGVVGDETGNLRVMWWNQPWVAVNVRKALAAASATGAPTPLIALSGRVTAYNGNAQMDSPEWEVLDDPETGELMHTGRMVPVYPRLENMYQKSMRRMVHEALDAITVDGALAIPDPVPQETVAELHLMPYGRAVSQIHYPDSADDKEEARRRLAFDELLVLMLAIASQRSRTERSPGIPLPPMPEPVRAFLRSLPFTLTNGQRTAIDEAMADVASGAAPMSRLLQGDVGSGKTVVAMAMLLTAIAAGHQGALMAPTEVLAEQHFINIRRMMSELAEPWQAPDWFSVYLDGHAEPISIGLLTGSTKAASRRELARRAADGTMDILVGTHALIQDQVELPGLALAVVDEQHRFGVLQRVALRGKGRDPHLLLMSATPIPRTLALTVYGDLDVSTMRELPGGRKQIVTKIVKPSQGGDAEEFLVKQASEGRQSFVVCPLIDESESVLARAATVEYERLKNDSLSSLRVGLLHGRMSVADKQSVMDAFRSYDLDVLVTTPVIEVGIDVPNATVMLIEGADRFGLAQLHQLRGRVGRGEHQSYCFLLSESMSDDARHRLEELVRTNDGFDIAEADLRLRGPGDFFGTRQSGLPTLRIARIDDRDLLAAARAEARSLADDDPALAAHPELAEAVIRFATAVSDEVA
jgi:ATP-dependent DNA helicase RecG